MKLVTSVLGAGVLVAGVWFGSQALGGAAVACGSHCERVEPKAEELACGGSSSCDLVDSVKKAELLACEGGSC